MLKILLSWLLLTLVITYGIVQFRKLNSLEKWQLTKTTAYATICSLVAVALLCIVVVVF